MKTRDRILEVSLLLFNEEGESGLSSVDIANALEISPGNLYYHFKGKDAIIDNSHVVCWDSTLRYEISITTGTSGGFHGSPCSGDGRHHQAGRRARRDAQPPAAGGDP
mgnify:CR=1 FL=1